MSLHQAAAYQKILPAEMAVVHCTTRSFHTIFHQISFLPPLVHTSFHRLCISQAPNHIYFCYIQILVSIPLLLSCTVSPPHCHRRNCIPQSVCPVVISVWIIRNHFSVAIKFMFVFYNLFICPRRSGRVYDDCTAL